MCQLFLKAKRLALVFRKVTNEEMLIDFVNVELI